MLNKNEFCFKADSYLPSEIRDEMVETFKKRVFNDVEIVGFLKRLPKEASLALDYREAKGDWEYIFGKSERDDEKNGRGVGKNGRGVGKNALSKAQFTVGVIVQGVAYGFSKVSKLRSSTGALESDIIGKSVMHFFETGERVVVCPTPKTIADALMDSIMHSVRKSTRLSPEEWKEYHEKYAEDMFIGLGMAKSDIENSRFRWCVTDAEMRVGLVEIARKQKGAIGLIVSRFPDEWNEALDILRKDREKLLDVQDGGYEGKMLKDDWDCIQSVRKLLVEKATAGRLVLYVGRAGTGKTTNALSRAKDIESAGQNVHWTIVTLSNNVGAQGAMNAKKNRHLVLEPFSIARCRYQEPSPYVIIDEFSQWGQETLSLFCKLLKESEYLLIMGDDRQMNSFLGKGSLLHDVRELLLKECPSAVTTLTKVWRQKENSALGAAVLEYANTGNLAVLEDWMCTTSAEEALKEWYANLERDCVIVTGANDNVAVLNQLAFRFWLQDYKETFLLSEEGREIGKTAIAAVKAGFKVGLSDTDVYKALAYIDEHAKFTLPVLMGDNIDLTYKDGATRKVIPGCVLCDGNSSVSRKFLRSEKALITGTYDGGYIVNNLRGGTLRVPLKRAQYSIAPCFAITVDKAQGNEWDDVMVFGRQFDTTQSYYNGNLLVANAFYVAVSRPRRNLVIVPPKDAIKPFETFTTSFDVQIREQ